MFGGNFQTWKLHSAQDYFMFFAYILAGVMVFWLIAKHMNKQRNHEKAVEKVSARLKKICGKPGEVLQNATLNLPDGEMTFDAVLMDKRGIYLVRTYGWGIKIYGTPDGAMWRREDAKRKEEFENPLLNLKKGAEEIGKIMEENGVHNLKVMPMVVFADNYQTPELYLGYGSYSTTYQELKNWYKKQSGVKEVQYDYDKVSSIIKELAK